MDRQVDEGTHWRIDYAWNIATSMSADIRLRIRGKYYLFWLVFASELLERYSYKENCCMEP